jgi:site-specific DNA-methyltransferase (cytosine-N4-specific)
MKKSFATKYGTAYNSSIEDFLDSKEGKALQGKVQLIFTSPPFPLVVPKKYGNKIGEDYLNWMAELSPRLAKLLKPNGKLIIGVPNSNPYIYKKDICNIITVKCSDRCLCYKHVIS